MYSDTKEYKTCMTKMMSFGSLSMQCLCLSCAFGDDVAKLGSVEMALLEPQIHNMNSDSAKWCSKRANHSS